MKFVLKAIAYPSVKEFIKSSCQQVLFFEIVLVVIEVHLSLVLRGVEIRLGSSGVKR